MQTPSRQADTTGMPGTLHQGILALLQEDPWLAFDVLGVERPIHGTPIDRQGEIERNGKKPGEVRQGYPDLVMVYRDPKRRRRGVVITIEAQKDYDADKRWMIPVYHANLAEKHRLQTWSVVVSLSKQMSRSIRAWRKGEPPRLDVLLLDVETVPKSPWLDDSARRPTAAVLVGALHGYAGDFDAARRGFHAALSMGGQRGRRHGMTVLAALPQQQRERLIGELPMQEQHSWMDVERRSGTYHFGAREALVDAIVELLDERRVKVDAPSEAKIRGCTHLPTLKRWVRRAVHVSCVADLFKR
jgi:hypothetical protein